MDKAYLVREVKSFLMDEDGVGRVDGLNADKHPLLQVRGALSGRWDTYLRS